MSPNSAITRSDTVLPESTILNISSPTSLVRSFQDQEKVFSSAFAILRDAIDQRAFPAASVAVTQAGNLIARKAFGHFVYEENSGGASRLGAPRPGAPLLAAFARSGDFDSPVTPETLFDLASVTKVIATTTMAAFLYERGLLELDAPVAGTVPEFLADACGELDPRRRDITFRMLLAHSSGLPAYEKLFLKAKSREDLLRAAFTMPLSSDPGTKAEYSDIGFIILGAALERLAEDSLDAFCQREIFGPLAMAHTTFNPSPDMRPKTTPTADERDREECGADTPVRQTPAVPVQPSVSQERSTFRHRVIQGEVQDENAYVLGGVAGHAGLFSTAEDVARFAHAMLQGGHPILRPATVGTFTRRESAPAGTSRAIGWDTPSVPSQSGKYFSPRSFGHLGYTGTSLWIDPERQLSVALLTNRTWPDCSNQTIKEVRPRFHDAIVAALVLPGT